MKKKHSLLLGAHMSISQQISLSIERGESIGCTAIQIFTKSNRQWNAKPLNEEEIATFKQSYKDSSIKSIMAHAAYIINIGSANEETEKKSIEALKIELDRCANLGIPYLVLHPGSYGTTNEESALERISTNLNKVLSQTTHCMILLETMAGQGSIIGYKFEHLAQIIKNSEYKERLGICLDTCHIFAAGYDFRTKITYQSMWQQFDEIIGMNKLKAIHINDSLKELGSRVDRHADIGKGKIGLEGFKLLLNDPNLFDIPKILETPRTDLIDYKKNMDILGGLLSDKTKKLLLSD